MPESNHIYFLAALAESNEFIRPKPTTGSAVDALLQSTTRGPMAGRSVEEVKAMMGDLSPDDCFTTIIDEVGGPSKVPDLDEETFALLVELATADFKEPIELGDVEPTLDPSGAVDPMPSVAGSDAAAGGQAD